MPKSIFRLPLTIFTIFSSPTAQAFAHPRHRRRFSATGKAKNPNHSHQNFLDAMWGRILFSRRRCFFRAERCVSTAKNHNLLRSIPHALSVRVWMPSQEEPAVDASALSPSPSLPPAPPPPSPPSRPPLCDGARCSCMIPTYTPPPPFVLELTATRCASCRASSAQSVGSQPLHRFQREQLADNLNVPPRGLPL